MVRVKRRSYTAVCGILLCGYVHLSALLQCDQLHAAETPAAVVTDPPTNQNTTVFAPKGYTIGASDVLEISVWGESELSKSIAVSPEGTINYPLLGVMKAEGMTPGALEEQIQERLSQGFIKDPRVNVSIKEFNSKKVMVFGLINKPGLYKIQGDIPVLELLFIVGNPQRESGNHLVIMRRDPKSPEAQPVPAVDVNLDDLLLKGDLSKNVMIKPGDVVYITASAGEKRRFYVMGEVRAPGPYDFVRPITLLEAIKLAGGLTEYAAPKRVQVVRKSDDKKLTFKFNLKDFSSGKKNDDFMIEPGDVVVVPESWF